MANELVVIEEVDPKDYPKFDLTRNTVKVFKGVEFDIDNFLCLQMLENHDPSMVDMVVLKGQEAHIAYSDGSSRVVTLKERLVLCEKYTEWLIDERARLYKNIPVPIEQEIKRSSRIIETTCTVVETKKFIE